MLNIPDLNRMKVFYLVYKARSLTQAAQSLNITRSAVSQGLKALETELGTRLFHRDSKQIVPTEPAEALFRAVEPLLTELAATIQTLESGRSLPSGHLKVGAPQDFGSTQLTEVIVEFCKAHPGITFELTLATPVALLEKVTAGGLDIAFVDNGEVHAKNYPVTALTVMKERFVLACSKRYFENLKSPLKPNDIQDLDFIDYFPHAPVARMWIKHHYGKNVSNLRVVFSAESVRAVIRAAVGGLGVCVVPEQLIESELKSGRLRVIPASGRELVNHITLVRRLEKPTTAREKLFVGFYKQRLR